MAMNEGPLYSSSLLWLVQYSLWKVMMVGNVTKKAFDNIRPKTYFVFLRTVG